MFASSKTKLNRIIAGKFGVIVRLLQLLFVGLIKI